MSKTKKNNTPKLQARDWAIIGLVLVIIATNLVWYNYSIGQDVVNQYNQSAIQHLQSEVDKLKAKQ